MAIKFYDKNNKQLYEGDRVTLEGIIKAFYTNEEEDRNVHIIVKDSQGEYLIKARPESIKKV
jgi:uncharacterized Zn ribbon protein